MAELCKSTWQQFPLASFSIRENCGSNTVLCTIAFQEPLDSAHGELSSGIKIFSSKNSCGKFGEILRL